MAGCVATSSCLVWIVRFGLVNSFLLSVDDSCFRGDLFVCWL